MSTQTLRTSNLIATAPSLFAQLRRAARQWIQDVQQARRARAAVYLELQALRQLDGATLRDLGLAEHSLPGRERRVDGNALKNWE